MTVTKEPFILYFIILSGLCIGSFLNVCIHRLPREESIVFPKSRCPKCGHPLAWYDNLPVIGFLLLRAKCRHCGMPISLRYPLVEII
ncbi:MAG: prepilin peptidase, partial [Thermodesulfobacteriota bacterium]